MEIFIGSSEGLPKKPPLHFHLSGHVKKSGTRYSTRRGVEEDFSMEGSGRVPSQAHYLKIVERLCSTEPNGIRWRRYFK